jgi:hypothetical protein
MTDHDARIDEALDALARPQPPPHHAARVLARTSGEHATRWADAHDARPFGYLQPRWGLPLAATLIAVLGATWQVERQGQRTLDYSMALDVPGRQSSLPTWGAREEIVQPVLPPQAYWGMDPFREFATLRPGTRVTADGPVAPASSGRHGDSSRRAADDQLILEPVPTSLPAIELVSIIPAPLITPATVPLEDITPAEIPLAPIVIAPLEDQERP